jgi:acylphosphatase
MGETTRRRFIVRGLVQGVGFRYWTSRHAQRLGLRGRVRNLGDGTVQVDVEGTIALIGSLRDAIRKGPPGARVESIEEHEPDSTAFPDTFEIARR